MADSKRGHNTSLLDPPGKKARPPFAKACLVFISTILVLTGIMVLAATIFTPPEESWVLNKFLVSDERAVCNDGSRGAYYVREDPECEVCDKWMLVLESAGSSCWNQASCADRVDYGYTSSDGLPDTKQMDGILSIDTEENPYFSQWNVATIVYCSSDYFVGTKPAANASELNFVGSVILESALSDIMANTGIKDAGEILIIGQGAGGFSVLLTIDSITDHFYQAGISRDANIRVLIDSAWWMDVEPLLEVECADDPTVCSMRQKVETAWDYWVPTLPERCNAYGLTWECFYAHLSHIELFQYPLFVFEWGYESAQFISNGMYANSASYPSNEEEEEFAESYKQEKAASLNWFTNITIDGQRRNGYFFPSCWAHELVLNENFFSTEVLGTNLGGILYEWGSSIPYEGDYSYPDDCGGVDCNPTCPANL